MTLPPNTPAIDLTFTLNVDLQEMATWPPQTVRAFMEGVAMIVSANRIAIDSVSRRRP